MAWKKLGGLAALSLAFVFGACGDDSSSGADSGSKQREVSTIYDLGACTADREGDSVYVIEKNPIIFAKKANGLNWMLKTIRIRLLLQNQNHPLLLLTQKIPRHLRNLTLYGLSKTRPLAAMLRRGLLKRGLKWCSMNWIVRPLCKQDGALKVRSRATMENSA